MTNYAAKMKTREFVVIFPLVRGEIINNLTQTNSNFMKYMRIDIMLQFLQILNILSCVTAIVLGIRKLRANNFNKILFLLPTISLIQILFSEIIEFITPFLIKNSDQIQHAIVATYSVIEFVIIAYFMSNTKKMKNSNRLIIFFSSVILAIALIEVSVIIIKNEPLSLEYFNLIEGIFIISFITSDIIRQIYRTSFFETFSGSEWIAKSGILLSFLVFWPNSVIQKFIIQNIGIFYYYLFISNSVGYLILFTFLSLSFYASGKSRNN